MSAEGAKECVTHYARVPSESEFILRLVSIRGNQTLIIIMCVDVSAAALTQNVVRPCFYMQYLCVPVLCELN